MKKLLYFFIPCILITVVLTGCFQAFFSQYLYQYLYFNGVKYDAIETWDNWYILYDEYRTVKTNENDIELTLRLYPDDPEIEYVFCEESNMLYHNSMLQYPQNSLQTIDCLYFYEKSNYEVKDPAAVEELLAVMEGECIKEEMDYDSILTLEIRYKNYPAAYSVGNIVRDNNGSYYLLIYDYYIQEGDLKYDSLYYPLNPDGALVKNIK